MLQSENLYEIDGFVAPGWNSVRDAFTANFIDGFDIGATVAVYHRGKAVIELSGGWKVDEKNTKRIDIYQNDTLQFVYSTSKAVIAAAVALCVERGLFSYDDRVSQYWPEFGVNGKESITIHDIMAHRAGLPAVREKISLSDVLNWSRMTELLAAERPFWSPGSKHGYHAVTIGFLAGELVRRVDPLHRSFGTFVREELAEPLNSELHIGIPADHADIHQRIAPLVRKSSVNFEEVLPEMDEVTELTNTCSGAFPVDFAGPNIFNDTALHQAELPAANLITNARSLARLYAALIGDIDDGCIKALISEKTRQRAVSCVTPEGEPDCTLFGLPTRFAMGFQTYGYFLNVLGDGVFGHNGSGGSCVLAYPPRQLAFAYVCNQLDNSVHTIDPRSVRVLQAVERVLDNIEKKQ